MPIASRCLIAGILTAMLTVACGERPHVNPLDPTTPITLRIIGPDRVTAWGDTAHYTVEASPEYEHGLAQFRASDNDVMPFPGGLIVWSTNSHFHERAVTITATLDGRTVTKSVDFSQVVTGLRIACTGVSYQFSSLYDGASICPAYADRRGYPVSPLTLDSLWSRAPGIIAVPGWYSTVEARANGDAWVVGTRDGYRDSVHAVVQQKLASLTLSGCTSGHHVGDTFDLGIDLPGYDARRNVMPVDSATLAAARAGASWSVNIPEYAQVSSTGRVTILAAGYFNVSVRTPVTALNPMAQCFVLVQ